MRLLFVVHRYGREVLGGAEGACRSLAERMVVRGHDVTVVTTRALHYRDWQAHYPAGEEWIEGVRVVRLDNEPRRPDAFDRLHLRLGAAADPVAPPLQHAWVQAQGPRVPGLADWLVDHAGDHDVCICIPYLYATTTDAVVALAGRCPLMLVPCAHPEPTLRLPIFDRMVSLCDFLTFLTPEEARLVQRRFRPTVPSVVAGLGVEFPDPVAHEPTWRASLGIGDGPFVVYVGRVDPSKGTTWLSDRFAEYKAQRPGPLQLVIAGDLVVAPDPAPDVVLTGPVDDHTRTRLFHEAVALVHPSPYESFSLTLMEAWAQATPVLAYAGNPVFAGHIERSDGGITFKGATELGACLDLASAHPDALEPLGRAGAAHVRAEFGWDRVLDRWEGALRRTVHVAGASR